MSRLRTYGGGGGSDIGFAAEADVFGRGAEEDVEEAGLDAEVVNFYVIEGEAGDRNLEGDGLQFAGFDVVEAATGLEGLHRAIEAQAADGEPEEIPASVQARLAVLEQRLETPVLTNH